MKRHWTNPADGRKFLVGTAEEAAEICGLSRDRAGAHQYRRMVSKPPKTFEPPPGPVTVGGVPLVDPATRQYLYDLNAVLEWNRSRPGRGRYDRGRLRPDVGEETEEELAHTG